MKIINPGVEFYEDISKPEVAESILKKIEYIGRSCYKSENQITADSAGRFVRRMISDGHEAMLEHASLSIKFIVDRGVSHEIVRHRMASFAQESTRYCNYSKDKFGNELTFIRPCFFNDEEQPEYRAWKETMKCAEDLYMAFMSYSVKPEEARSILPNSLKTELWMTANMREWRHFLKLRAAGVTGKPHPQMAEVAIEVLKLMKTYLPDLFFDIPVLE